MELEPDDFAARYELKMEQDRLRKLGRRYASDRDLQRASADLMAELRALDTALEKIRARLMNVAAQAGGGGAGAGSFEGPLDAFKINNALLSGSNAETLIHRIARLETILKDRGDL